MNNPVNIFLNKKEVQGKKPDESAVQNSEINSEIKCLQEQIDQKVAKMPKEYGGRSEEKGLEPTRYGDWELKGRCVDF